MTISLMMRGPDLTMMTTLKLQMILSITREKNRHMTQNTEVYNDDTRFEDKDCEAVSL